MNAWAALLLTLVMGVGVAGIGMGVMHDAAHGAYSEKKWVNSLVEKTMYLLGDIVFTWKIQHNVLHHTYTSVHGLDEDIADKGVVRLSQHTPWRKIHQYQHILSFFFYGLMTISMLVKDVVKIKRYEAAGFMARFHTTAKVEMTKILFVKTAYGFIFIALPILLTPFSWWQCLLGFMAMHFVAGFIMSVVFQLAHVVEETEEEGFPVDHHIGTNWAVHELLTTANFAPQNALLTWYAGGLNFQVEHHLFPSICHIHYPKIAPIVAQTAKEYGIPYHVQPTFGSALASHVRKLKALGQKTISKEELAFA